MKDNANKYLVANLSILGILFFIAAIAIFKLTNFRIWVKILLMVVSFLLRSLIEEKYLSKYVNKFIQNIR